MKKQIHLNINEEVEIYVAGKRVLTIDQVSDENTIDCFLYSEYFAKQEIPIMIADGCFGKLLIDLV